MLHRVGRRWRAFKAYLLFGQKVEVFGRFSVVNPKNVRIGKGCAINHDVILLARDGIDIGDSVILSARAMIVAAGLDPATFGTTEEREYRPGPIRIEHGAWIGAGAIIMPGVTVGTLAIVGAGAVVTRDVAPHSVVAGNPARPIRQA